MRGLTYGDVLHGTITTLARKDWKALDALHAIMYNFKHHGRVMLDGKWYNNATVYQMPEMLHLKADEVCIYFWGGPSEDRKWRQGTMLDYLLDSCLFEISLGDPEKNLYHFLSEVCEQSQMAKVGAP